MEITFNVVSTKFERAIFITYLYKFIREDKKKDLQGFPSETTIGKFGGRFKRSSRGKATVDYDGRSRREMEKG